MNYYQLNPPVQWQAAVAGPGTPTETVLYFDCADCGAKAPEIAGFAGSGPTFSQIAVIPVKDSAFVNPAMFCAPCFSKRLAENAVAA